MLFDLKDIYNFENDIINKFVSLIINKLEYKDSILNNLFEFDKIKPERRTPDFLGSNNYNRYINISEKAYMSLLNKYLYKIIYNIDNYIKEYNIYIIDLLYIFIIHNEEIIKIITSNIITYKLINLYKNIIKTTLNYYNDDKLFCSLLINSLIIMIIEYITQNNKIIYISKYIDEIYKLINVEMIQNLYDSLNINSKYRYFKEAYKLTDKFLNMLDNLKQTNKITLKAE